MSNIVAFNLASCKAGKTNITKESKWLKEGAHRCQVLSLSNSKDRDGYNGAPYLEYEVVNERGESGRAKFWVVRDTDSPKSAEWKTSTLHEFLVNCGVAVFTDDANAIQEPIGSWVNICFTYEEYMTLKDGQPVKRKAIRYRWSSQDGGKIKYDAKYNKPISPLDEETYIKENSATAIKATIDDDGDLPF
jgi:hypothetical protein|tara:strand:+ start:193 stop:762 length:570 start_codon:yes stop_codon:yes gene_type:complete